MTLKPPTLQGISAAPTCDWQAGTTWSPERHVCGKAARWQWIEPSTGRQRFTCGIHARSVRSLWSANMQTNLRLIGSAGKPAEPVPPHPEED